MPKNVNLNPFKTVTVALVAFAVLLTGSVAWSNPVTDDFSIKTKVSGQDTVVLVTCDFYYPNQLPNDLKTTKGDNPILHLVMPALPIPPTKTNKSYDVTEAHISDYWDQVYKESDGWDKGGRTATTSYNCHGHSSGRQRWMAIQPLLTDDYDERTTAEWTRTVAIFGDSGHTGRIAGTLIDVPNSAFAIYKISEKYAASAVYERVIEPQVYYTTGEVIPIVGSPFFDDASPFYVPKP